MCAVQAIAERAVTKRRHFSTSVCVLSRFRPSLAGVVIYCINHLRRPLAKASLMTTLEIVNVYVKTTSVVVCPSYWRRMSYPLSRAVYFLYYNVIYDQNGRD